MAASDEAAAKAKARAEARRKRLLAGAGDRLARLGPGLEDRGRSTAEASAAAAAAACPSAGSGAPAEGPRQDSDEAASPTLLRSTQASAAEAAAAAALPGKQDAWALSLRARRLERSWRFLGASMLGLVAGLDVVPVVLMPPVPVFLALELVILTAAAWSRTQGVTGSEGGSSSLGQELVAALLTSALGKSLGSRGSSMLVQLSFLAGFASAAWKLLQDAALFLFALLVSHSIKGCLASAQRALLSVGGEL
eukprot:TRINITY_DN16750_c0_g1_i1.p1 TRINITY_DN16750_c0_g1~~TRINITY_DN16750_c0_g1_i1.p1  ORF type:complete len:260 (-),score=62.42 TRINITY_DN16750_c0_g1_i1:116-868(-)